MNYYYLDAANQPAGPLPLEEIRRKAAGGEIPASPMVAAVGTSQWRPLTEGAASSAATEAFEHYLTDRVGAVLDWARRFLQPAFLDSSLAVSGRLGHIALLLGAAGSFAYIVYRSWQNGSWFDIIGGIITLAGLVCAQFAARHFFRANESLLKPTLLARPVLLDGAALLALFSTVSLLLGTVVACIRFGMWQPLLPMFLTGALWVYLAIIALHPATVKVGFAPQGEGEEVMGIIAWLMKTMLKLLPLFFCVWTVLGCVAIILSFFDLSEYVFGVVNRYMPALPRSFRLPSDASGFQGLVLLVAACLMVPAAHVMFLAVSLPLDLWRALLSVPARLDALRK